MAAKLKAATGVDAELVPGSGGVFDVMVDGRRVFSKHEVGNFPDEDALTAEIAASAP